ncbi:uncharacterized protein BDR25DRAFT_376295, partial [Lindgomyces ingoldianus]
AGRDYQACSYDFNVTISTILGEIAGVETYCRGYEDGSLFKMCRPLEDVNNGVVAKFLLRNASAVELGPKKIAVSSELGRVGERWAN